MSLPPAAAVLIVALWQGGVPATAGGAPDLRLVEAVRAGDRAAVATLIGQNADVNAPEPNGATALHWATHRNDQELADVLIRAGARVNAANQFGVTPLWLAGENGSASMIATLLRAGADPNAALPSGETPLMAAVRTGQEPAVRALVAGGARVAAKEAMHGQTALMWAAAENHLGVMRLLIEGGADVNEASIGGFTPLLFVARQGNVGAAALLLDKGADLNGASKDGSTPLLVATVRGHVELACALLERGANPNVNGTGFTPLHWASGVWEAPITFDYRFTGGEWAALGGIPSRDGKLRLIKALLARGADVNARLTKSAPRINSSLFPGQRLTGATPFFLAAQAADGEVLRLLMASGADTTIRANDQSTPLIGASGGFLRVDYETRIPESDVLTTVKLLLELGSDINAANQGGETALHAAALSGLDTVVEYLVSQGASLTAKTKDGKTPLAVAERTELSMQVLVRPSTVALLRKLGAQ